MSVGCATRLIFRRAEFAQLLECFTSGAILYFGGYCLLMLLFFMVLPIMMAKSSATMFNLSLLTVNFLCLFAGLFIYGEEVRLASRRESTIPPMCIHPINDRRISFQRGSLLHFAVSY